MKKETTEKGVQEIALTSWKDLFALAVEDLSVAPAYIYRGQADYSWPVMSSLDRLQLRYPKLKNLVGTNPKFYEVPPLEDEEHLSAFRRAIRGRRGVNSAPLDDDSCWALGQHHGLATPLLDWTRSPFVALFFAFEQEKVESSDGQLTAPENRAVFAVSTSVIETGEVADAAIRVISPMCDDNSRLISQSGVFLKMPRGIAIESYVQDRFSDTTRQPILIKIKIPNEGRPECLIALNKMNINYMTLFPDISGAARHVNSLWQPGHEDSLPYV